MDEIKKEIKRLEANIEWEKSSLNHLVADFKEAASKYEAYDIETFIPGKVTAIADCRARIQKLTEQRAMLIWMVEKMKEVAKA